MDGIRGLKGHKGEKVSSVSLTSQHSCPAPLPPFCPSLPSSLPASLLSFALQLLKSTLPPTFSEILHFHALTLHHLWFPLTPCLSQGEDGFPGFKGDMGVKGDRVSRNPHPGPPTLSANDPPFWTPQLPACPLIPQTPLLPLEPGPSRNTAPQSGPTGSPITTLSCPWGLPE